MRNERNWKKMLVAGVLTISTLLTGGLLGGCGGGQAGTTDGLREKGELRVAMECAYAPYNWTQSTDSDGAVAIEGSSEFANGYDVKIAKKIAAALNLKLRIVKSDWDSLIPAVQSGTVDCVIAGQSIKPERLQNVDFTKPYYYADIVTLTLKDSKFAKATSPADLAGAKATSQQNTIWYDLCLPQIPQVQKLAGQNDVPAMLVALISGAADVVVTDIPTAKAALRAYPQLTMLKFDQAKNYQVSESDVNIGISVRKGNAVLKEKIDQILDGFSRDDMNKLMDEAITQQPLSK